MTVGRLGEVLERRLDASLDHVRLRQQASALLRPHVGYDLAVWAVLDPATLMWSSCVLDGGVRDEQLEHEIFVNEYSQPDVLKLVDLADGRAAGSLHAATGGDPLRSQRFREVLAPRGVADELRVLVTDGGSAWGALCLLRSDGVFDAGLAGELATAARPFGSALRRSLLRSTVLGDAQLPPVVSLQPTGLVLAGRDGRLQHISEEARALLRPGRLGELPQVVQAVVARRAAGHLGSVTAPTEDGRWLSFSATPLGEDVAVVVEQVRPQQLAEIIVRARGLTVRERQVVELVVRGRSNRQIATALALSEYTVQDHLKAVFAKFDVSSRTELSAALFFTHFAPLHVADTAERS